jgi:hypothetical protein
MTIRRWMLGLGVTVFVTILAAFVFALATPAPASCTMEGCGGTCTNDDFCAFGCTCDLELGECNLGGPP